MALPAEYAHLIEAMPDGVVVTDRQGRIVHVNGLFEKLTGYAAADLVGRSVDDLVPDVLRGAHARHRQGYYEHGMPARPMAAGLDISLRRSDGTGVPVDIALGTMGLDGEPLVLASVRDVSDRKLAEATIRENERRWSDLLERVQLLVVGLDREGRVTYANPYLLRLTGHEADQTIGADWFEMFIPDHIRDELRATFRELIEDNAHGQYENEIVTRRGTRRTISWFNTRLKDVAGDPSGTISIGEDVTDRRRTDARVRAHNEVAQAILTGGSPDNLLHQVSRSAARLLGADAGALLVPRHEGDYEVRAVAGEVIEGARSRVFHSEGTLVDEVMLAGRTLVLPDVQLAANAPNVAGLGEIGPVLLAPLWVRGDPFGVLLLANHAGGRAFDLDDAVEAEAFASQAAVALAYGQVQQEVQSLSVLAERERIARDLHDTVIQRLFATGMTLQAAEGSDPEKLRQRVQTVVDDLDSVIREIRGTIFALESAPIRRGLRADLLEVARQAAASLGFVPRVRFEGVVDAVVPETVHEHAVSTLQDALSTLAREGRAHRVQVHAGADEEHFRLRIESDTPVPARGAPDLDAMRRRAEAVGGRMEVRAGSGGGAVIEWTAPLRGEPVSR